MKVWYTGLTAILRRTDNKVYGAVMNGANLFKITLDQPSLIIMGNESNGISHQLLKRIDRFISIPGYGGSESLNVSVATGIIAGYLRM